MRVRGREKRERGEGEKEREGGREGEEREERGREGEGERVTLLSPQFMCYYKTYNFT